MEKRLKELEYERNIEILYACEAGSRAWDLSTPESDHDIRFIYKYKDLRSYLSLKPEPEIIDLGAEGDIQGWDVFKAFHLLNKSNPNLYEWVFSPLVYKDKDQFSLKLKKIILESYSHYSLVMHYLNLATRNTREVKGKGMFQSKNQKQLIHAVKSMIISKNIIERNSITDGPFFDYKRYVHHEGLGRFLYQLVEAKKAGELIPSYIIEAIINEVENDKERLLKQTSILSKGRNESAELNNWLWELLAI